jgi:hypothetical protein
MRPINCSSGFDRRILGGEAALRTRRRPGAIDSKEIRQRAANPGQSVVASDEVSYVRGSVLLVAGQFTK